MKRFRGRRWNPFPSKSLQSCDRYKGQLEKGAPLAPSTPSIEQSLQALADLTILGAPEQPRAPAAPAPLLAPADPGILQRPRRRRRNSNPEERKGRKLHLRQSIFDRLRIAAMLAGTRASTVAEDLLDKALPHYQQGQKAA